LQSDGIIEVGRGKLLIRQPDMLAALATEH
jgi:hypothetical protein